MKQFGGRVTSKLTERYSQSPNWNGGKFHNLVETTVDVSIQTLPKLLYKQFCESSAREPKKPIPVVPFEQKKFLSSAQKVQMIWYGHSVLLLRINDLTILIDPMLGPNASPIAPFSTNRFSKNTLEIIDALPPVDLLLLTHDHYDHLDLASMEKLKPKVRQYFAALGTGRHLVRWGVHASSITEFDWWDTERVEGVDITFTPSRHFSGRGLSDRAKSLWGGWVLKTADTSIYFSGDGGYGAHFKKVGAELGPFDFGLMECGQYNKLWHQIHLYPEESVQAALDAGVQKAMPVHWGGFALAQHHWKDPVQRFVEAAEKQNLAICTPKIGEQFNYADYESEYWWESHA